ncbi:MAG: helix-turn-helix transcriptional regulator [Bacteroidota bacterium]
MPEEHVTLTISIDSTGGTPVCVAEFGDTKFRIRLDSPDQLSNVVSQLHETHNGDESDVKPFVSDVLLALIEEVFNRANTSLDGTLSDEELIPDPFLEKILETIEHNFTDPEFGVNELADILYVDRTWLFRKLKKTTGRSARDHIYDYRMEYAAAMLVEEDGHISKAAYAAGFRDLASFNRVFKRYYDASPREYYETHATSEEFAGEEAAEGDGSEINHQSNGRLDA